ncbi:vacuolar protein sorting-associated protein 36-like isoform X4 [Gossypium australe]|uniref:Vacuolar protein sorting-associated protein 36-like isoform X4 n=1 Tax=Gossypium australe TaxID=47621 RepID=A0A5B6UAW2_9ROSI|nr:vacuolar protein sorting-associated protein 36-like isoform X4 [Gossypium australe]
MALQWGGIPRGHIPSIGYAQFPLNPNGAVSLNNTAATTLSPSHLPRRSGFLQPPVSPPPYSVADEAQRWAFSPVSRGVRRFRLQTPTNAETTSPSSPFSPISAPKKGFRRRNGTELGVRVLKSLQDAFQDLNALMSKAKEMVMLAEKNETKAFVRNEFSNKWNK